MENFLVAETRQKCCSIKCRYKRRKVMGDFQPMRASPFEGIAKDNGDKKEVEELHLLWQNFIPGGVATLQGKRRLTDKG